MGIGEGLVPLFNSDSLTRRRHPGENRGPVLLGIPGFRLPPE